MLVIFYLLLMLSVRRCSNHQIFETKTAGVGDNVRLTCTRKTSGHLYWIRLVSGKFPEVLGKTFTPQSVDSHIKTTEETGEFVLGIQKAKLSDTGLYYCVTIQQNWMFLKGTDLRVEGPAPVTTAVPPSDRVRPADSVTLQCSVLSENKTCPGEHSVCWCRTRSDESHPNLNYIQGNSLKECEKHYEGLLTKKCIYGFLKNISSSDAGTYYCAVATCGETLFGNRSTSDINVNMLDSQKEIIRSLLCAALAISLIVIAFLIYLIKKLKEKSCGCCNAAVALQTNASTARVDHQNQETDEDSLVYSAPTFTSRKSATAERRNEQTEEEQSIYSDVRALGLD